MLDEIEIRVRGTVGESVVAALPGLRAETRPVVTVLSGNVADAAALHGVLHRIRALGLELVEVRRAPR